MKPSDLKPGERCAVRRGIYAYRTKEGRLHYGISYTHRGRIRKEIVGPTIRFAERALSIRKAEIAQGRFHVRSRGQALQFSDFALRYIIYAKANKKSWETDEFLLRRIRTVIGNKKIDQVTAWNIEQYKAWIRLRVSPRTVNMELSLLRRMFNLAIVWGLIETNPLSGVKALREQERPMRILTPDEETKLRDALPPHLKDVMTFALHTGMRRGEILSLPWSRVDLKGGVVTLGETKTGKVRYIPLNAVSRAVLERQPRGERVFTWHGESYTRFDKTWQRAVKAAEIPPIRFHDLRHTFATRLVEAGEDISVVQELLGHASILMTRRYAHPSPEHRQRAVAKLETYPGGPRTPTKLARRRKPA